MELQESVSKTLLKLLDEQACYHKLLDDLIERSKEIDTKVSIIGKIIKESEIGIYPEVINEHITHGENCADDVLDMLEEYRNKLA